MIVELIIAFAIGYIPCTFILLRRVSCLILIFMLLVVDNFGTLITIRSLGLSAHT